MTALLVALGAAVGAPLRYVLTRLDGVFPEEDRRLVLDGDTLMPCAEDAHRTNLLRGPTTGLSGFSTRW